MDPIEAKMSKSKPDTMISIHDTPDDVKKKLSKAFCPEKQIEGNPVLEICKFVIFPDLDGKPFGLSDRRSSGEILSLQRIRLWQMRLPQDFIRWISRMRQQTTSTKSLHRFMPTLRDILRIITK